nr:hypothetical protein [Tanacetum cinerariifolium]
LLQEALDACVTIAKRVEHLEYDKVAQALEITKLKRRVKRLEKGNKVKVLKLRRLQKVGTSQRVDTYDDTVMDDESIQERMIDEIDKDDAVVMMDEKEEDKKVEEAKVDEITTASAIISAAEPQVPVATITVVLAKVVATPSRRRKGVIDHHARSLLIQGLPNDIYSLIDSNKTAKDLWDALGRHMLCSEYGEQDRNAAVFFGCRAKKMSKTKKKIVVSSESEGNDDELKKITTLLAKAFNQKEFYSKPTNNNLRSLSATFLANKKQESVKYDDKIEEKKVYEKKRDISKVKCYNCKIEGHFAKDYKKAKVKDCEYYKTKMLLAKKDRDEQVILAEGHAWMESSSDSDKEINANIVFMAQMEKEIEKFKRARDNKIEFAYDYGNLNASCVNEKQTSSHKLYVPTVILETIIIDLEDEVVSLLEKEKVNLETIESLKSKGCESSENAIFELENQSENDFQVVEKDCDNLKNSNVIALRCLS